MSLSKPARRFLRAALATTQLWSVPLASAQTQSASNTVSDFGNTTTLGVQFYTSSLFFSKRDAGRDYNVELFRMFDIDPSTFHPLNFPFANFAVALKQAAPSGYGGLYVMAIDGIAFQNIKDLNKYVSSIKPGSTVEVMVAAANERNVLPFGIFSLEAKEIKLVGAAPQLQPSALNESKKGDLGVTGRYADGLFNYFALLQITDQAWWSLSYLSELETGDMIKTIDGKQFATSAEMKSYIESLTPGSKHPVGYLRLRMFSSKPYRITEMQVGNGGYYDEFGGMTVKMQDNGVLLPNGRKAATFKVASVGDNSPLKQGDIIYEFDDNHFPNIIELSCYVESQAVAKSQKTMRVKYLMLLPNCLQKP